MLPRPEIKTLDDTSNKIQGMIKTHSTANPELKLPIQNYQPFFLKVMNEFIKHHNLSEELPLPQGNMRMHVAMSCILNVIAHSMGEENKKKILKDLEEYKMEIPSTFRNW